MPTRAIAIAVVLAGLGAWAPRPAAAQTTERVLQLAFDVDGSVNLRARNVTPRDILAEWARLCQCHLVNAEGLRGDLVTVPLLFEHQPQSVVLASLLREAGGYVLTPRRADATGPSAYETIFIVPTSAPAAGAYAGAPTPALPPVPAPIATRGSPDNEIPPVPDITAQQPAAQAPGQPAANRPPAPTTGLPTSSVFVPIIAVPNNPFTNTPNRGGGPGTATPPPPGTPGQAPAPPGTVGANP